MEKVIQRRSREKCGHKPRNANNHQTLEQAKNTFSLELAERVWLYRHLDFRFVASRSVGEYIFVDLSHSVCSSLLQLWETKEYKKNKNLETKRFENSELCNLINGWL